MRAWLLVRHLSTLPTSFNLFPSQITHLLQLCSNSRSLNPAKQCHLQIIQHGLHQEPFIITKLVQSYAECDFFEYARKLFDELPEPNVFAWTALLAFYSRNGLFRECLMGYREMRVEGVLPDQYVFPKVLRACAQLGVMSGGAMVHKEVIVCGAEVSFQVGGALIDMYSKCGQVGCARRVFEGMVVRDLLCWNAMISGYVANGLPSSAVELFELTRKSSSIEPDLVTFNSVMDAYCGMGLCDEALKLFNQILEPNVISWTTLISGLSKTGDHGASLGTFRSMMSSMTVTPDVDSLSSAIVSCRNLMVLRNGQEIHAYGLKAHYNGTFYSSAGPALLTLYSKCGEIHSVRNMFESMDKSDVVSWNAMIFGLVELEFVQSSLKVFTQMNSLGIRSDQTTISTILPVCDLNSGGQIHAYVTKTMSSSATPVSNALISMYCKCGSIDVARVIFSNMLTRDLVSWNTMIGGLAVHGQGQASVDLLEKMMSSGVHPDAVTLTSALAACSYSGLVDQGLELFAVLTRDFDLVPKMEHFGCLVDMLARAGRVREALGILKDMSVGPDRHIWGTLLAAGEAHHDLEVAKLAAEKLVGLEPDNAGHYVTLSNIYARQERWEEVTSVRRLMEGRGLLKPRGRSWTGPQHH